MPTMNTDADSTRSADSAKDSDTAQPARDSADSAEAGDTADSAGGGGAGPSGGHCLCGGVAYTVEGPMRPVWNCHCWRCRRWTGHFMAGTVCRRDQLRLTAESTLTWHRPESRPQVAYGFCRRCGSSLFWKVIGSDTICVCAGTLDPPTGLSTERIIFTADASDYHTLDPAPVWFSRHPHD